jgi:hypothetical protein
MTRGGLSLLRALQKALFRQTMAKKGIAHDEVDGNDPGVSSMPIVPILL